MHTDMSAVPPPPLAPPLMVGPVSASVEETREQRESAVGSIIEGILFYGIIGFGVTVPFLGALYALMTS